eukprot:gene35494-60044_t
MPGGDRDCCVEWINAFAREPLSPAAPVACGSAHTVLVLAAGPSDSGGRFGDTFEAVSSDAELGVPHGGPQREFAEVPATPRPMWWCAG